MKVFRIDIDVSSTTYDTCSAYIEAETEDEAHALFSENPYECEWDDWETVDSEIQDWTIGKVEHDEYMTNHFKEKKIGHWAEDTDA